MALNNLAWLLAVALGKGAEAEPLIDRAVEVLGPIPALRDTGGIIRLTMDSTAAAVEDLEEATLVDPSAVGYFHLARAHQAAGKGSPEAKARLQPGRGAGARETRRRPAGVAGLRQTGRRTGPP